MMLDYCQVYFVMMYVIKLRKRSQDQDKNNPAGGRGSLLHIAR